MIVTHIKHSYGHSCDGKGQHNHNVKARAHANAIPKTSYCSYMSFYKDSFCSSLNLDLLVFKFVTTMGKKNRSFVTPVLANPCGS